MAKGLGYRRKSGRRGLFETKRNGVLYLCPWHFMGAHAGIHSILLKFTSRHPSCFLYANCSKKVLCMHDVKCNSGRGKLSECVLRVINCM
jgi:hypothetical protein